MATAWSLPVGPWTALILFIAAVTVYKRIISSRKSRYAHLPLPPGPTRLPVLGNIFSLPDPKRPEHTHWKQHHDLYGPISAVEVLGTTLVLLHDRTVARELLANAPYAAHTAGRPEMVFAGKMCGYEKIVLCRGNDEGLRHGRKMLARELGSKEAVGRFEGVIEDEVRRMVGRMGRRVGMGPGNWFAEFQT
jgi:hypothetical protein